MRSRHVGLGTKLCWERHGREDDIGARGGSELWEPVPYLSVSSVQSYVKAPEGL